MYGCLRGHSFLSSRPCDRSARCLSISLRCSSAAHCSRRRCIGWRNTLHKRRRRDPGHVPRDKIRVRVGERLNQPINRRCEQRAADKDRYDVNQQRSQRSHGCDDKKQSAGRQPRSIVVTRCSTSTAALLSVPVAGLISSIWMCQFRIES